MNIMMTNNQLEWYRHLCIIDTRKEGNRKMIMKIMVMIIRLVRVKNRNNLHWIKVGQTLETK